jgi:DNA replication and repair protein RecF
VSEASGEAARRIVAATLRDFRCYRDARVVFGAGLTVVSGANGAGKTNLLEATYFACTGASCRTSNEREVVRFGASSARVELETVAEDGPHELSVGLAPGQPKRLRVDRAPVERMVDVDVRPLAVVFLPDRLELIKGPPAVRRAHMDQLVAALWPARVVNRRAYAQALAQRNALIAHIRATGGSRGSLGTWDVQLARSGVALMSDRAEACRAVAPLFAELAQELGLDGEPELAYSPRSRATEVEQLAAELAERHDSDLERGFTGHGPHRDELGIRRQGRDLRAYGSQGQQRLGLLALLLAEREALGEQRGALPLLLLDDVMSELDHDRRRRLVERLRASGGQAVITTTDLNHVPGASDVGVARIAVAAGSIIQTAAAA